MTSVVSFGWVDSGKALKTSRLFPVSPKAPVRTECERTMRRRGYSLIELLVVMGIIALILGFILAVIQQVLGALRNLTELAS